MMNSEISEQDLEAIMFERIAKRIFGSKIEVGRYDHDGKYLIKFRKGHGLIFQDDIDRLEDHNTYCKNYAIMPDEDQISLIVQLKKKSL